MIFKKVLSILMIILFSFKTNDSPEADNTTGKSIYKEKNRKMNNHFTRNNDVRDIVNHPAFNGFSELLLPRDHNGGSYTTKLSNIGSLMPLHGHVHPDVVIGALNYMIDEVKNGRTISYDFYTSEQKVQEPDKKYSGLFYFRGNPDAPCSMQGASGRTQGQLRIHGPDSSPQVGKTKHCSIRR